MWREEAITRERVLIDQDGMHAHTQTLAFLSLSPSPAQRGDAVAPRIGSVHREPAGGKEGETGRDEYRLVELEDFN